MIVTKKKLVKAFARWQEDFVRDPKAFASDKKIKGMPSKTYGERAADTLLRYLKPRRKVSR